MELYEKYLSGGRGENQFIFLKPMQFSVEKSGGKYYIEWKRKDARESAAIMVNTPMQAHLITGLLDEAGYKDVLYDEK
jgi:hypothetical protein